MDDGIRDNHGAGSSGESSRTDGLGQALPQIVGAIFREARSAQRLSQRQVAALTEGRAGRISRTMISAIESGRSLPGLEALVSLSRVLQVDPLEILERVDLSLSPFVPLEGRTVDELVELGRQYLWAGDYRRAVSVYESLARRLDEEPSALGDSASRLRARVEINRAVVLRRAGALKAAQHSAQRAVELASSVEEHLCEAYIMLASVLSQAGFNLLARDASERSLTLAPAAPPKQRGQAWSQHGSVLFRAGDFDEARRAYLRAHRLAVRSGDEHHQLKNEGNIGACLLRLGHRDQARQRFLRAVAQARDIGENGSQAYWLCALAEVALDDGRYEQAEHHARAALQCARPGHRIVEFRAEWVLHQLVRRRDPEAPDRRRLATLRKLWGSLREQRGSEPVRAFEEAVIAPERRREGRG